LMPCDAFAMFASRCGLSCGLVVVMSSTPLLLASGALFDYVDQAQQDMIKYIKDLRRFGVPVSTFTDKPGSTVYTTIINRLLTEWLL
jgi:hypothetical protein